MAGPEAERNEESSYIFISTPTELGKVKDLQSQEVSGMTEGTSTESAVAPLSKMTGPVERIDESSKDVISTPMQSCRVQDLQTEEVSDMTEGMKDTVRMETATPKRAKGRPKLHTPRMAKKLKKLYDTSRRRINIGNQITRWNEFKNLTGVKSNEDAARVLLDRYFGKKLPKKTCTERKSSFVNPSSQTVDTSEGEECQEDDSTNAEYEPCYNLSKGELENLQLDCETVSEDTLHEDSEMTETKCLPTPLTPREPGILQMDCETVNDDNLHENAERNIAGCFPTPIVPRNNRHMSGSHAHVLPIHGLAANQPFSFKYSSPSAGSMIKSKNYVIVKQHFLPIRKTTHNKIDVKERVFQISLGPSGLKVDKSQKRKIGDLVDTGNLKQSMGLFETHSDSPRGMPVIDKESDSFETITIKTEWDEDEKYGIISDIMKDLIEKVVREGNISRNHEYSNSKRKTIYQTKCNITKKPRLLKYADNIDSGTPHSSRSRSRGYRINYADLNKSGGFSDESDFEDILSGKDGSYDEDSATTDKIPSNTECEITDDSGQKKSKVGKQKKKDEDPDFDLDTFFMMESSKKNLKDSKINAERSTLDNCKDSESDSANDECNIAEKKMFEEEKIIYRMFQKRLKEGKRIKVFLKDHPDKYYSEDQVSTERKFRGLKEAEKTFKLLVCALCKQFRTSNTVLLETHIEHHLNGDWKCKKCNFEGNAYQEYRLHMNESHPSRERCFVCEKKCGRKKQLQEHLVTVHNLLPYICIRCSTDKSYVMFKEKSEYHQHYLENHKDIMHQCNFCGLHFMSSAACRVHACSGKESDKVTCDICGKEISRYALQAHKRNVHDNVRPFPCQLCSYAARNARSLRYHNSAKHEGLHGVQCDICDFTCVAKYQLVSHMRTHTGDKPYKCDQCPYAAAWNVQLKEHKQLHGNPIGKECEVCGIVVRQGVSYSNHYKKHHKKN